MVTSKTFRVGIDIGGTFTDFVLFNETTSQVRLHKCLTTPRDPSQGALQGLVEIAQAEGIAIGAIREIVHGTTLVTNTVIERKGARVGLLTTAGFRDTIEIGTEQRYDVYDLFLTFPEPLVERARRLEIDERMAATGAVVRPLDEAGLLAAARKLLADGVEAIAVCFLHSYRNPTHERRARDLVAQAFPQLSVSISSEVVAEIAEYSRFVTTCANAYVQPLMASYISRLEGELARLGFSGALRLMHSAGGLVSVEEARAFPIRLLESGPAGGALATAWFGKHAGKDNVISFDMGGTTAKACLVERGKVEIASFIEAGRVHRFKNGSGMPIKAPVVDMIEIGAGGGSIAHIDEVGLMRVGPASAGAEPGPACYGNGGTEPTVTDASVVLGYYDPTFFLGGRIKLDVDAAAKALAKVGDRLGISALEAAWGVHKVVSESMASAAQIHLVEKGKDPRAYAMIGFGGAGPAFAARVARVLGVSEVIVPPASGAASAFGFLAAPLSAEIVRSWPMVLSRGFDVDAFNRLLGEIEEEGRRKLRVAGVDDAAMTVTRNADMRLVGQLHEIAVPLPAGILGEGSYDAIRAAFKAAYTERYTKVPLDAEIEALSFRLTVSGPDPHLSVTQPDPAAGGTALKGVRQAYFGEGFVETKIIDRYALRSGDVVNGPAIIEERESTTIVPTGDVATVDDAGNLRIAIATSGSAMKLVTADMPHAEAVRRIEADPIGLEIMWSRLVNVAEEMWYTVCRTAFSLIISEIQDFGCAILDAKGGNLAHSARAMPVFNMTLPMVVKGILERYPIETLKPGDVLITNDPWLCAGHLYDLAIVTPVFRNGRVVAIMGSVGHVGDIGGTKERVNATELYEEGLQIPPIKLMREGVENEDLFRILAENVRGAEQVLGDTRSLVAANETGARRLLALMDDYGLEDISALAEVIQSRSERAMRDAIRNIPNGIYESEVWYNPLGTHLRLPVKVTVADEEIEVDFEGAPREIPKGAINCTIGYTKAHAIYPFKCMLTPSVRGNAGCFYPIKVKAPSGSVMNCNKPAPVTLRTRTGWYISPNIFNAMSDALPDRVLAFTGLGSMLSAYGATADGAVFYDHLLSGGGQGASSMKDGHAAVLWPTSAGSAPIELIESRSPILFLEKSLVQDSGGPGKHRGGLGVRIRMCKRDDDGAPMTVVVSPEGVDAPVDGFFGGGTGAPPHGCVRDTDGNVVHDFGTGGLLSIDRIDHVVELQLSGGSGFGEPSERTLQAIENDRRQGYISEEMAERLYALGARRQRQKERKSSPPVMAG